MTVLYGQAGPVEDEGRDEERSDRVALPRREAGSAAHHCLISGLDCLIFGLDCLISGLDCLIYGLDCLISGLDCLISGLDCLICI